MDIGKNITIHGSRIHDEDGIARILVLKVFKVTKLPFPNSFSSKLELDGEFVVWPLKSLQKKLKENVNITATTDDIKFENSKRKLEMNQSESSEPQKKNEKDKKSKEKRPRVLKRYKHKK